MDAQALKTIVDTLNVLGTEARSVFIWWLLVNYGISYLIGIAWTIIGGISIMKGFAILRCLYALESIASAAGYVTPLTQNEIAQICQKLRKDP